MIPVSPSRGSVAVPIPSPPRITRVPTCLERAARCISHISRQTLGISCIGLGSWIVIVSAFSIIAGPNDRCPGIAALMGAGIGTSIATFGIGLLV